LKDKSHDQESRAMRASKKATIVALEALIALALAFAIVFTLYTIAAHSAATDEWLPILTAIERQPCAYKENPVDRAFIRSMINQLTLDDPPELTWRQRRWLETLKKECKQ
jgi:hypothetical protein